MKNKSESEIEKKLKEGVKNLGGKAFKFVSPGENGVTDRLVIYPGGIVHFIELKAQKGSFSKLQLRHHDHLNRLGCTIVVIKGEKGVNKYLFVINSYGFDTFKDRNDIIYFMNY